MPSLCVSRQQARSHEPQSPYDAGDSSSDDGDQLQTPNTDDHDHSTLIHFPHSSLRKSSFEPLEHLDNGPMTPASGRLSQAPYHFSSPISTYSSHRYPSGSFNRNSPSRSTPFVEIKQHLPYCVTALHSSCSIPSSSTATGSTPSKPKHSYTANPPRVPKRGSKSFPQTPKQAKQTTQTCSSQYTPNTLARKYSSQFPQDHHLQARFVRSYQLCAELGSGGYGFVMSAIHRHEGHEVAVKFIIKSKIPEHSWAYDDDGNRIPLEAKMLSLVNHPGIIKFIDLFEDEVYFYLVEELHGTPWSAGVKFSKLPDSATMPSRSSSSNTSVSDVLADNIYRASQYSTRKPEDSSLGLHLREEHSDGVDHRTPSKPEFVRRPSRDLFECIEQSEYKRLSEADARYIFAQVVDIVDYLDDEGITHRDVKDENLVIDENLKVKLIDFGSVVITDPTQPRPYYDLFYGTAAYASSEILRKMPYQAPPAEIWTLGVLLSYLLTGSSPFPSETHALEGKVKLDEQCGARVSRSCLHLMKRCLDADPERRADIKEVKAHPWLKGALARRC